MHPPPRYEEMQAVRLVPGVLPAELAWDRAYVLNVEWQNPGEVAPSGRLISEGWHYEVCLTDEEGEAYEVWYEEADLLPAFP